MMNQHRMDLLTDISPADSFWFLWPGHFEKYVPEIRRLEERMGDRWCSVSASNLGCN